jgi:hypothetical protein
MEPQPIEIIALSDVHASEDTRPEAGPSFLDPKHPENQPITPPYEPSAQQLRLGRIQTVALCWAVFAAGWNDGSLGPLLPRIQDFYGVSTPVVSALDSCSSKFTVRLPRRVHHLHISSSGVLESSCLFMV